MLKAIDELWMYTGEMFKAASYELLAASEGIGVDPATLKIKWEQKVKDVLEEATLYSPSLGGGKAEAVFQQTGGKEGKHTEHLGYILTDLQYMQRAYPGCEW
jgi:ring-1,2-phenylacetyl-CoA epoxidase subunit PaaC